MVLLQPSLSQNALRNKAARGIMGIGVLTYSGSFTNFIAILQRKVIFYSVFAVLTAQLSDVVFYNNYNDDAINVCCSPRLRK